MDAISTRISIQSPLTFANDTMDNTQTDASFSSPPALSPNASPPEPVSLLDLCDNPPCPLPASIVCGICNEAPYLDTDPQVAQYCSSTCQKKHLKDHVKLCDRLQDRMTLFRVMGIAQRGLYVYREMSWHAFEIESVEERDDMMILKGMVNFALRRV